MSNARMGRIAPRTDSTRTAQAKAATLARKQARMVKATPAPVVVDRVSLALQAVSA